METAQSSPYYWHLEGLYRTPTPQTRWFGVLTTRPCDLTLSTARFTDLDVKNEAIKFVRRRSRELFAGEASKGRVIASNIAFAAAVLGA